MSRQDRNFRWSWLLVAVTTLALQACALRQKPRYETSPVIFDEPAADSAAGRKRPVAHLEGHVFPLTSDENVVGSVGIIELRYGDTLSAVARHYGLGYEEISAANPSIDPWVINDHTKALVPLSFILPKAPRRGVVINLAAMRLFHYPASDAGTNVVTYPVGIGKEGRSTPTGAMAIARKTKNPTWRPTPNILKDHLKRGDPLPAVVPPGPDNPLGQYAMYLTAPRYLIHGTNKPYSIGLRASNGCIRLYPENIEPLFNAVPAKTPVTIVNQPYLIGSRAGVTYLQAYQPHEEVNDAAAKQRIRSELKALEAARNQAFDWAKIDRILAEARGIPFPISSATASIDAVLSDAILLTHPGNFFGQEELPPENPSGWHVFAAETASELSARRMAGIMNHQGPPIPARVLEVGERYQVIAGPFPDAKSAQQAARRLKVDLELQSRVLAPETALAGTPLTPSATPSPPPSPVPTAETPEPSERPGWTPEPNPPAASVPPEPPTPGAASPVESWPEYAEPAPAWPEPNANQEFPTSETAAQPTPAEGTDAAINPSEPTEQPAALPGPASPLDLTLPEQFANPEEQASEPPLEFPPDLIGAQPPANSNVP